MWYVMQVRTGTEENIRCQCQRLISSNVLERCFIPYYQQKKRFQGEWHIQERILFPGYVFLITQDPEKLVNGLRKVIGLTKLIGTGDEIVPLVQEEIDLLMKIGTDKQLVEMSSGIIENDRVQILAGPLMGMEGNICRIDRHKRMAYIYGNRNVWKNSRNEGGIGNYKKRIIKNDGIFTGKRFCKYAFLNKKEGEVRKTYVQEKIKRMV